MYSPQKLPWDALVYGAVHVDGSFHQPLDLKAGGELTLAPASSGEPVNGHVTAAWDARAHTLDLGRSSVSLPHSRIDLSGAVGAQLRVHLETSELDDLLPAIGKRAADLPVKLNHGTVVFDGSVTGDLAAPRLVGHLRATSLVLSGKAADVFEGDVIAAPSLIRLQDGTISRGTLHAQLQGSVVLSEWKTPDTSPIAGTVSIRNGPLPDLLAIAGAKSLDASGTLGVTAYLSGTVGAPRVEGDVELSRGSFQGEPFDHLTAHAAYSGQQLELARAQITAGAKQVRATGSYTHLPGRLDSGGLRFDVTTSAMALASIHTLHQWQNDLKGTAQASARGEVQIDSASKTPWRVISLDGEFTANGLELANQPVGDAHLTARSQAGVLTAHLDSTAAGASVKGDGEWQLQGEYPGRATLSFTKVDLANLRAWIGKETVGLSGSADGELRIEGPMLDWKALQAELRSRGWNSAPRPIPNWRPRRCDSPIKGPLWLATPSPSSPWRASIWWDAAPT